ncbi:sporulation histidine kinase inhibitor Sda [Halobacillus sp. BBL2006]|uniref:sporulation histidine kinase inhibitor Sda n=1 Tax=Halobacillus sp. BBL2006 TaxID=1543706 RepID=UPI000AEDC3A3|nr:sporulation histidine kinase inhibitor Sda [Halobacillus sp. BBL2006]
MIVSKLTYKELISTREKAVELKLDTEFIRLLETEITKREVHKPSNQRIIPS